MELFGHGEVIPWERSGTAQPLISLHRLKLAQQIGTIFLLGVDALWAYKLMAQFGRGVTRTAY